MSDVEIEQLDGMGSSFSATAEEINQTLGDLQETPSEGRQRNERGQFVAQQDEPVEETQAEEEPGVADVEEQADDRPEWLPQQFQSPEDLARSYQELRSLMDSRGLQQMQDEIRQLRERLDQPAAQPQQQPNVDWESIIDQDPARAAQLAFEYADANALRAAVDAWKDEDPFSAATWVSDRKRENEIAMLRQEQQAMFAPVFQQQSQATLANAYNAVVNRHPDFESYVDSLPDVAQRAPEVVAALQQADQASAERVLENLYLMAKGAKADSIVAAAAGAQQVQAEQARQAKQQATVTSATSSPTREAAPLSDYARSIKESLGSTLGVYDPSEAGAFARVAEELNRP